MEMGAGDYMSLKHLFAFKGARGTAPASVVDAAVARQPGQKEALDALLVRGAVVRKGGDYVWDWMAAKEEGMARLSGILSEAFKYTGDAERDFTDEHPLIPDMVIDTAVEKRVKPEDREKVSKLMKDKFAGVYKANRSWAEKILNGRGNSGRDTLFAFANHWIDSHLAGGRYR
jgi:hypothetical protein